ncbi:hypothetical protein GCM10022419_098090 [Nonomuraea rosea]|uniref:DUF4111 domain-containing protein n=1 Tax=Nonomuraea rosea TaxID=638574 RepID=A0ABP6ZAS9_9ACTN
MTPDDQVSHPTGRDILRTALGHAETVLNGRLQAAFALGSLAHGGFVAEVSDVDLALIVDRIDEDTGQAIETVRRHAVQDYAGSAHHALAERLSIFWSDWEHLSTGRPAGRFPATDRIDLLDSGVRLHGTDRRGACARPSHDDLLLDSATFGAAKCADPGHLRMLRDPGGLARQGARAVTKAVLLPVRLLYTVVTGALGRNDTAAHWYAAASSPSSALVTHAMRWRAQGIDDVTAAADLLGHELLPLYRHSLDRIRHDVAASGHSDLAARLTRLHATLA